MPRGRDPNRDRSFEIWRDSGGEIDLVEIASRLGVAPGTVRGWKSKDNWEAKISGTVQPHERNAPKDTERSKRKKRSEQTKERNNDPQDEDQEENDGKLTAKQMLFVLEYLRDYNATRAAMVVGYSKKTAYAIGWENLRKPQIQAEIKRQKEMLAEELGLDVRRVIAELMKIAFADISDVSEFGQKDEPIFDDKGKPMINPNTGEPYTFKTNYMALKNADEIDTSVISEVKQGKGGVVSVKLYDKLKALEKLERYLDFMTEEEKLRMKKLRADIKATEAKEW